MTLTRRPQQRQPVPPGTQRDDDLLPDSDQQISHAALRLHDGPAALNPRQTLTLQRAIGNRALQRALVQRAKRKGEDIDAATHTDFAEHAQKRQEWGLQPSGTSADGDTVARLTIGSLVFWGRNAHGRSIPKGFTANAISRTHAEGDVMIQAFEYNKANGGALDDETGNLLVDRAFCPACGEKGGAKGMARSVGLGTLNVASTLNSDADSFDL